jgi:hypothetical protein
MHSSILRQIWLNFMAQYLFCFVFVLVLLSFSQFFGFPTFLAWVPLTKHDSVKKKVHFINSSQNERLSPSCIALTFDGLGTISRHSICFLFRFFFTVFTIFWISYFFGLSTTDETWLVEMHIWCMKFGIVLVLYFSPWVEASAGQLLICKFLHVSSPVAKYFDTCLKYKYE